jgi:predicted acylesterase/phospholipase RssA
MDKKIKLVLSGSGTRYPVHVGGIIRLQEEGYEIVEVCGTSGGAIIAAGIASGYNPSDPRCIELIKTILPSKSDIIDYSLKSLWCNWGLVEGNKLQARLKTIFKPTFKDAIIPLHIVTTNIDKQISRVFSTSRDPDLCIGTAVHASMAIPGIFAPVKINDNLHVDGGVISNYFLDIFGSGEDVIGLRFGSSGSSSGYAPINPIQINNLKDYINATISSAVEAGNKEHIDEAVFARTITLKTKHPNLNFKIGDQEVDEMIDEGYKSVNQWLKRNT